MGWGRWFCLALSIHSITPAAAQSSPPDPSSLKLAIIPAAAIPASPADRTALADQLVARSESLFLGHRLPMLKRALAVANMDGPSPRTLDIRVRIIELTSMDMSGRHGLWLEGEPGRETGKRGVSSRWPSGSADFGKGEADVIAEAQQALADHRTMDWKADERTAGALMRMARVLVDVRDDHDALIVTERAVAQYRALAGKKPSADHAAALLFLADLQAAGRPGKQTAAEANFQAAAAELKTLTPANVDVRRDVNARLAQFYLTDTNRTDDARKLRRQMVDDARRVKDPARLLDAYLDLAKVEIFDRKPDVAIALLTKALESPEPTDDRLALRHIVIRQKLADLYNRKHDAAREEHKEMKQVVELLRTRFSGRLDWTKAGGVLASLDRVLGDEAAVVALTKPLLESLPTNLSGPRAGLRMELIEYLSGALLGLRDFEGVLAATGEIAGVPQTSGSKRNLAMALLHRADALGALDRFAEADRLYRQILSIDRTGMYYAGLDDGSLHYSIGAVALSAGRDADARDEFAKAEAASAALDGDRRPLFHAKFLLDVARQLAPETGGKPENLPSAEQYYRRVLAIFETVPDADETDKVDVLLGLSTTIAGQGRLAEAIAEFERRIAEARKQKRPATDIFRLQDAYAQFLRDQVGGAASLAVYRAMFEDSLKIYGPSHDTTITIGINSMSGEATLAQLAHTRHVYDTVFRGRGKDGDAGSAATVALAMMEAHVGDVAAARALLKKFAAADFKGDDRLKTLFSYAIEQAIGVRTQNFDSQLPFAKLLLDECKAGKWTPVKCEGFSADYGKLLYWTGHPAEALPYAEIGLKLADREQDRLAGRDFRSRRRLSDRLAAEYFEAFGTFLDTLWTVESASAKGVGTAVDPRVFRAVQRTTNSEGAAAMAFAQARLGAGSGELATLLQQRQKIADKLGELDNEALAERMSSLARLVGAGKGKKPAEDGAKAYDAGAIEKLTADYADLDRQIREKSPAFGALLEPAPVTLPDVQKALGPKEAVVLLTQGDLYLHIVVVTKTGSAWRRSESKVDEISVLMTTLLCHADIRKCPEADVQRLFGSAGGADYTPYDVGAAHRYYSQSFGLIEEELSGIDTIYFVAEGGFAQVPPAMLVTRLPADAGGAVSWLADRHEIIRLPSVAALLLSTESRGKSWSRQFEGYGDPLLDGPPDQGAAAFAPSRGTDGLQLADVRFLRQLYPLHGSRRELEAMEKLFPGGSAQLHIGGDATETHARFNEGLAHARIISFATHGLLPTEVKGVDEPGLVLTPPTEASPGDDGLLTASEVAQLHLTADMVILSACNTASAEKDRAADSMSGLARAFLFAGADSLLASHWRVSDDATVALMIEMLRLRNGDTGMSRARALRLAMQAVRSGVRADGSALEGWQDYWAHPSAWAGFSLIANSNR